MAGRGSYLGGSTILKPWRDNVEEGWEPHSVVISSTPEPKKEYSSKLGRYATPFEIAFIKYSQECAQADANGIPRPEVPAVIRDRYSGKGLRQLKRMISKNKYYNPKKHHRKKKKR